MLGIKDSQYGALLIVATLLGAVMSGLYVVGVGNAVWWFLGPLAVSILFSILLTKDRVGSVGTGSLRQNWSILVLLPAICCVISLGRLTIQRELLPVLDLGTLVLMTVFLALTCSGLVSYLLRLPLLSFPMLFLGVTFLFTLSPLILYRLEGFDAFKYWHVVDIESVMQAMPLVMLAFSSFLVGALFSAITTNSKGYPKNAGRIIHTHSDTLRKVGILLYLLSVSIVVVLSLRGGALSLAYQGGYRGFAGTRKAGDMPRIVTASLSWFLPWSLLILTATSQNRRAYVRTLLMALPACGLMFLSGDRAAPLALILLLASGSYLLGFPIDWKRTLIVIALVALLVPTIVNLRGIPIREWSVDVVFKAVTNQVEGKRYDQDPLSATLTSTSTSYQTLMGTVMFVPVTDSYRYGLDYVIAMASAIPFAGTLFSLLGIDLSQDDPSNWVKSRLNPDALAGTGYLQVAEAYLEFGPFGVICLYAILGAALTRLWWYLQLGDLDSRKLVFALISMIGVLTWVRNDAGVFMRTLLYGWMIAYGIPAAAGALRRLGVRLESRQRLAPRHRPIIRWFAVVFFRR